MREFNCKRTGFIVAAVLLGLWVAVGCVSAKKTAPVANITVSQANGPMLKPNLVDARIAYYATMLMKELNYSQLPLDPDMSKKIFNGYVDTLDPRHENFLQSDIAEFTRYQTNLDDLLVSGRTEALTPAFDIFERFRLRTEEHTAYVNDLLKEDKFKFNTEERLLIDRRKAPFPKDLTEAETLWQQRLRFEFLQEKLSREISPTNAEKILPLSKTAPAEIAQIIGKRYHWNERFITNFDSDNVLQAFLNAMTHAFDPHSDYFNQSHAQDFQIGMSLSLFGIGAQLTEDDGYCTIRDLVRGGPAAKDGRLKAHDHIIAVAQSNRPPVDVVAMELEKVVQLIRGPKGTEVRLTVSPEDDRAARHVINLVRDEIKLEDSEAKAKVIESTDRRGATNRIGIIDLPSFYAPVDLGGASRSTPKYTTVDVAKLIKKLEQEKVGGIVLDLRNNPGGSLEEAVKLTGLFIRDGPVVLARSTDGHISVNSDIDSTMLYDGPLIVLVNRFSASASEIAAAALQDYGRAIVVGDTSTFGKGTVQRLEPLRQFPFKFTNDPGTVKITVSAFYRITGDTTQWKGVEPDIVLPDTLSYRTDVESERTLDNSLQLDPIQPVRFDRYNMVQPYLLALEHRSSARVATNQDFVYVRQDIEETEKTQTNKSVTLNERDAIKERQMNAARAKERDAERAARQYPVQRIYDVTVENADQPLALHIENSATNGIAELNRTNAPTLTISNIVPHVYDVAGSTNTGAGEPVLTMPKTTAPDKLALNFNPDLDGFFTTNVVISTNAVKTKVTAAEKKSPPPFDPVLDETERILQDYVSMLPKGGNLTADH